MSTCFEVYERCVQAIQQGFLVKKVSLTDKEFHFQNWVEERLQECSFHYEKLGRNRYPDFTAVEHTDGYEVKGLALPGRDKSFDTNSQVPSGYYNGRTVYYVFGRYPAGSKGLSKDEIDSYPVIDLIICHGDFININRNYVHENKHVKGFGSYGDIIIRDRKMYVAPTPFHLAQGTTGVQTLIIPEDLPIPKGYKIVGRLVRKESDRLTIGYSFDLRTNKLTERTLKNPNQGQEHQFLACRLTGQSDNPVTMV